MQKLRYRYRAYKYRYRDDRQELKYIIRHLKAGDIGVDIGCHKGGYLFWLQRSVGRTGQVFAFEPQPKLFFYLREIADLYGYQNVHIENMGMSSQPGMLDFYIPVTKKGSSPGAKFDRLEEDGALDALKVEVTTLDEYFFSSGVFPQLLKIDVEGHEKQVLLGGQNLLQTCKPRIVMECENRHLGEDSVFDVFDILLALGYKGYFIHHNQIKPLAAFQLSVHQAMGEGRFWAKKGYVNNFIFEANGR